MKPYAVIPPVLVLLIYSREDDEPVLLYTYAGAFFPERVQVSRGHLFSSST